MQAINPATEQLVHTFPDHSNEEMTQKIQQTQEAFLSWRTSTFEERTACLQRVAELLKQNKALYAELMTNEMGKPITESEAEIEKCAWVCEYYAQNAQDFLKEEIIPTEASNSYISFQPLGIILAIMPWNFPFWQVFRFAVPALAAGNAALLKHAPNVPGCARAIEELFRESGFPPHLLSNLFIDLEQTSRVIEQDLVRAVTLTGSTRAGRAVAEKAGACLKKTVLELGGSDAYIILEDADLDEAIQSCVKSRMINNGQSCISAKRFIVPKAIKASFESGLVTAMKAHLMGDPGVRSTTLGPMARKDLRDNLARQVASSVAGGAKCLLGGTLPDGTGYYYPPTVLTDVKPGMPAFDEELFGPVAAIIGVDDHHEAIAMANHSAFGLGAAVFSADENRARQMAETQLEAGSCFVNDFVRSDPRLPFGGIKDSGYGRELSHHGIKEFTNVKTVYVK